MSPESEQERRGRAGRWLRAGLQASTIGMTLVVATVMGFGLGLGLDRWLGTSFDNDWGVGWCAIVGTLLGIAAGFREMIRTVIRLTENEDRNEH